MEENLKNTKVLRVFESCLLVLLFLMPLFFLPAASVSLYSSKIALVSIVLVVFIASFFVNTISTGKLSLPKSKILIPVAVFPLIALISSYFSGVPIKSIAGEVFELGTSGSFFILSLLFILASLSLKNFASGLKAMYAFVFSSAILSLHLILRVFAPVFPQSIGTKIPNFLVGGPMDTAVVMAAFIILALSIFNYSVLSKRMKYMMYFILAISVLYIGATGFTFITVLVGIFSLVYFVYTLSWSVDTTTGVVDSSKKFTSSIPSLVVLVASVVFILSGSALSSYLSGVMNINVVEIRPNFSTTLQIAGKAIATNPPLGIGPNMFKEFWDMNRPIEVNTSDFWNTEFSFGSGFVPTVAATMGILGLASILFLIFFLVKMGYSAIFSSSDERYRMLLSSTFFTSLFLWIVLFAYSGSFVVVAMAFIFSGLFVGACVLSGFTPVSEINILKNPKSNFVSVFVTVVLLIFSIAGGYFVIERVVAASSFNNGNVESALRMVQTDRYWRYFSEASLVNLTNIVNNSSSGELTDTERAELQGAVSNTIVGVQNAIAWNPKNFENYFALGRVYEILASNGLEGASESSVAAYTEASYKSPNNPAVPLALARLDAIAGNFEAAREKIGKSLSLKNNYTDAYFTLAQVEASTNNIGGAIQSVEAATILDSQNASLFFQLGLLKYNNKDFRGASVAFERSVALVPDYANARYFLGLSYERLGRRSEAIGQFEEIQKTNPDNAEVNLILENLREDKSPFANAEAPVDPNPEKRLEPPIQ